MNTIGISAHGAYVPKARLPRDLIAAEWGGYSMGGEKAVANGDGGAAVVVGSEDVIAEIVETVSLSDEFLGSFRTDEQAYAKSFPGFDAKVGYGRQLGAAMKAILAKAKVAPDQLAAVVIAGP